MSATAPSPLPELDEERIGAMEQRVFSRIADDRRQGRSRRRSWYTVGGAAAALVLIALVVAPAASTLVTGSAGSSAGGGAFDGPAALPGGAEAGAAESADAVAPGGAREMISSGSATLEVDDAAAAADAIADAAVARGGYVESVNVDASRESDASDTSGAEVAPAPATDVGMEQYPYPYPGVGDGWITVRVPAAELDAAIRELDAVGEVTSSSVSRQDVTDQTIDVRARIAAAETSVARLTELLAQSQSIADLIAAESALQERQAALDADRQQLAALEGQIELASLAVQLVEATTTVEADPAGFGDGIAAGWNGLVATLNGIVIGLGFLLPWIAVLAVIAAIAWGVVRLVRRRRREAGASDDR